MSNLSRIEEFIRHTERVVAAAESSEDRASCAVQKFQRVMEPELRRFLKAFASDFPDDLFAGNGPLQMATAFSRMEALPHPEDKYILLRDWEKAWQGRGGEMRWQYAPDSTLKLTFSPKHEGGYHEITFTPRGKGGVAMPLAFPLEVTVLVNEDMDDHVCADDVLYAGLEDSEEHDYECHCEPETVVHETRTFADSDEWKGFGDWLYKAMAGELQEPLK